MAGSPEIQDIETFGRLTRYEVVRAEAGDHRGWLSTAPLCSLLKIHHISHVGRMWAKPPFRVIRADASGTFVLVGLDGEGETLIDGSWRVVKAGGNLPPTGLRSHGHSCRQQEGLELRMGAL